MFAVIESGGKQHTVSEGDNLKIELVSAEEGSTVEFDKVLMISDGDNSKIGSPYVENAKVTGKLVSHRKIIVSILDPIMPGQDQKAFLDFLQDKIYKELDNISKPS